MPNSLLYHKNKIKSNSDTIALKAFGIGKKGFTIVELLIVVVVIAILATITIISFNNITARATESSLKSDLRNTASKLGVYHAESQSYPTTLDASMRVQSGDNAITYSGGGNSFCLSASSPKLAGKTFHLDAGGSIAEGECPLPVATTMQTFTAAHCAALPVYTGSNDSALRSLTDSRGGIERTYRVARLADNKCWMLDNLKLGSTTGAITLTPADSNISTGFSLPQVQTGGTISADISEVYGPIPGDTGVGVTNYGYLYNFSAATAGESRTSFPASAGDALSSICPANWRLPSGGSAGEFAMLNAKMNNPDATAPTSVGGDGFGQNWQNTGPFKGVLSGYWSGGFFGQGANGSAWSRSARSFYVDTARNMSISSGVAPDNYRNRTIGLGVRCLLD